MKMIISMLLKQLKIMIGSKEKKYRNDVKYGRSGTHICFS